MKGFTLIELILVIVLLGIFAAIGSTFIGAGLNNYIANQRVNDANWQGRQALENMARRISAVRSTSDFITIASNDLKFTDLTGNTIEYNLSGTTLQLILNGTAQVLADGVSSLAFTYYNSSVGQITTPAAAANIRYIQMDITITLNNVNYSFRTLVAPRNL